MMNLFFTTNELETYILFRKEPSQEDADLTAIMPLSYKRIRNKKCMPRTEEPVKSWKTSVSDVSDQGMRLLLWKYNTLYWRYLNIAFCTYSLMGGLLSRC